MDTAFDVAEAAPIPSTSGVPASKALMPVPQASTGTSPTKRPGMSALDLTGAKISQQLSEGKACVAPVLPLSHWKSGKGAPLRTAA